MKCFLYFRNQTISKQSRMNKIIASLFLSAIAFVATAQTYNGPESVEYDVSGNRYLISNKNNGQILARDASGNLSIFATGISPNPYGLEMAWGNLYACCGGYVYGYNMSGVQIFSVNTGGTFLNGIAHDNNGNLYVTDFSAKKIFRVNISTSTFNVYVPTSLLPASPNGIIWDQGQNRLVLVSWGSNVAIKAISLADSSVTTLATTTLSSCDGIAEDGAGNFYVSNWGAQSVVKFSNDFSTQSTVMTGLFSPADIYYNIYSDTLAVPNSSASGNNVVFQSFAPATSITVCNNVPLTLFTDSTTWGVSDGFTSGTDSMIRCVVKNTSNYSFAYPEVKFNFLDPLPSGVTVDAGSLGLIVIASAWNPGVEVPAKCYFNVTTAIPANYLLHFILESTNLTPANVDTCMFADTFMVNLNPQSVSVININENNFSIYPNPATNEITVYSNQLTENQIIITNIYGQIIYSSTLIHQSELIYLSAFTSGIYFISINNAEGKNLLNRKLIKE